MELKGPSIPVVNLLKDRGNVLFKEDNISSAALHYKLALKFLCFLGVTPLSDQPMASSLAFSTILNLAFYELKLSHYTTDVLYCTFVLTFEPSNVKALYRRGSASKHLNSLTKTLEDFESALKIDTSNKDVNRELLSLVDQLAINLNGKRVALQFEPLAINKRGENYVSSPDVVAECVVPCKVEDHLCRLSGSHIADLGADPVNLVTSPEVMDCVTNNCRPSLPVESESSIKGSNDTSPCTISTSEHSKFVFTNKKHAHKRLQLSSHADNNLMLGRNIEFFHPRSGAVLRVRPLNHKTSIQSGTLHDVMSWEAAVPTSVPLEELSQSKEATVPNFGPSPEMTTSNSVYADDELPQEESFVRIYKKKRVFSNTSYAS
ncbi:uncharacterized protein LOC141626760 [Silene latifolia]|uniref:uncharacterized protein LOC141626760 n=1 Tax=Silene latifolia TaxID=37657 RepID=UPI003D773362